MSETIIKINNLTKKYDGVPALVDVSLELSSGQIVGLLGPNGSGKTTLIKCIAGLLHKYQGELLIDGQRPNEYTKSIISYLPDDLSFAKWMKGKDVINLYQDMYQDFNISKMNSLLDRMNIDTKMMISKMSKGTKEKFQLALVMSRDAKVYLLDEPIGGVDPAARDLILDTIISNYNPDAVVIISTHLIQDVEKVLDSVIFLNQGKVTVYDEVDSLRNREEKSIDELFREEFRC